MKSVQIIQELKTGQRLRSFQVILISQTIMPEEALPCAVQFCNVCHDKRAIRQSFEKWAKDSLCLWRDSAALMGVEKGQTDRKGYFRLPIPCLVCTNFLVQATCCTILSTDLLWYYFYKLCPLLRFKTHAPLSLKSTDALIPISVLLSFDYSIKHEDTRTCIKIT